MKNYYIAAAALFAVGLILTILAFTVSAVGIYGLIFSMIAALAGVSVTNACKKKYGQTGIGKALTVACYAVMIADIAIIVLGIIVTAK